MIKVIMGKRGAGKSKKMIELANLAAKNETGDIVFINNSRKHMYDLDHEIRFINGSEFDINNFEVFYGFVCGIISEDFDISHIYIDGISQVINDERIYSFKNFFEKLQKLSEKFNINFTMAISDEPKKAPDFLKECLQSA